jgi:hypothetical protein
MAGDHATDARHGIESRRCLRSLRGQRPGLRKRAKRGSGKGGCRALKHDSAIELLVLVHWIHIRRIMAMTLTLAAYRRRVWDEHAAILKAIEAGDVERAGALAEGHTSAAAVTVIENLEAP